MAQFLRPASDVDAGEFLPSTGSDLYATIDESSPDDGDYVYATGNGDFTVGLSSGTDPTSSTGHIARYRAKGNGVADLRVTLMQGGTPIASWTEPAAAASFTNYSHTLSGAEADAITDYTALRFKKEVGDFTAPTLSSPQDGTPTSDGTTGPGVSTNEGNGTLYWAVLTNGGSCTDAQLKAGSGGNIVAGKAGNQAVSGTGAQVTSDITGLSASTDYELVWLHRDAAGNDSAQATVGLTTAAGGDVEIDTDADGIDTSTTATAVTSAAFTVGNNANRVLVAFAMGGGGSAVCTGMSYATGSGGSWSQVIASTASSRRCSMWVSVAPATGSTSVQATFDVASGSDLTIQVYSLYNVDQTTPIDNEIDPGTSTVTINITTTNGLADMVLAALISASEPGVITSGQEDLNTESDQFYNAGSNRGASSATIAWTTAASGRALVGGNVRNA